MSKQGFSAPDASWFKGESIDFVRVNYITIMHQFTIIWINYKFKKC